ncbi:short-chain dehydrogenase/reductase [Mycobacteroides abscessus]|nr:short-chain dehydrogenase/reductase [Mycobacteroides abscessus]AMU64577.1 short-chain dehydrogenase [Mycobacteroides abscessus]ANO13191.1 short-chain dehydrogenase [Mycobacteroides abscessus]ARQ63444.1 short-chain dehydrogenase [Mycobacteroides abscessus subsp. massiliense]MBL3750970.1 SDR family NAD(P)-dependent oxidoreductase [Mycobacteroides abscessus subsp. massiliense]MBN7424647.1 SDR family NAD(P)-dependent oxidoreductase [Mycobacteroides abscessus subsp. massiliense]
MASTSERMLGQVAVITGGANGIGAEVARELSGRGASVAVLDCDAAQAETLAGELGDGAMGLGADVADPASLAEAMDAVVQRFGGIDVVVANAGIAGPIATVAHVSAERWQQVIDVNLVGVFHTVRLALPHVQARRGYMMVVASAAAALPGPTFSAYMASKWGVEALARALRMELSDTGVGVGIAYFGLIDTQLGNSISGNHGLGAIMSTLPDAIGKAAPVSVAAAAVADGIVRRKRRVYAPRWVPLLLDLRTAVYHLDGLLSRNKRLRNAIREANVNVA